MEFGRGFMKRNRVWLVLLIFTSWLLKTASGQELRVVADRAALMVELTNTVAQSGWVVDMGRMCAAMQLRTHGHCKFKQLSVSASEPGTVDNYGFNVPLDGVDPLNYVVFFHLGPLVGNFFLVSSGGELKAAFYRAKGVDYTEMPIQDARRAFDASFVFWSENLTKLKELIAKGNLPRK